MLEALHITRLALLPAPASPGVTAMAVRRKTAPSASRPQRAAAPTKSASPAKRVVTTESKSPAKRAAKAPPVTESSNDAASALIDRRVRELADWRGATLAGLRALIHEALPDVVETMKWGGTPVWEQDGILCTGETYQRVVKLTFAQGASLPDPSKLFNSSLDGKVRRAIDVREGESLSPRAFKALMRAAAAFNATKTKGKRRV